MGNTFSKQTFDINYHSTIDIAKKAKNNGVKNFILHQVVVYMELQMENENEASPINPLTTYAKSKILSEEQLEKLSDNNFIVTCLRFATACGWSPRLRLDLVLNDFVASAFVNNEITIMSDGKPWRPLINVNDMACSIEWAMNRKINPQFLSINVGSNEWNYKIIDLAMAVKKLIPKANIHVNENAAPDKRSYQVDFSEYEKLAPLHQPKYNLEKTVDEIIVGLENIIFSNKNYRTSSYWIRLKTVNQLIQRGFINNQLYWK